MLLASHHPHLDLLRLCPAVLAATTRRCSAQVPQELRGSTAAQRSVPHLGVVPAFRRTGPAAVVAAEGLWAMGWGTGDPMAALALPARTPHLGCLMAQ